MCTATLLSLARQMGHVCRKPFTASFAWYSGMCMRSVRCVSEHAGQYGHLYVGDDVLAVSALSDDERDDGRECDDEAGDVSALVMVGGGDGDDGRDDSIEVMSAYTRTMCASMCVTIFTPPRL